MDEYVDLSDLPFPSIHDGSLFDINSHNYEDYDIPIVNGDYIYYDDGEESSSGSQTITTDYTSTSVKNSEVGNAPYLIPFVILYIVAFTTGTLGCLLAAVRIVMQRNKLLHYQNVLHLLVANFGVIIILPFNSAAALSGRQNLNERLYTALSFIRRLSDSVAAFQLTFLVALRCKVALINQELPSVICSNVTCFLFWILAAPVAVLATIKGQILPGAIMPESTNQLMFLGLQSAFSFIIPSFTMTCCFLVTLKQIKRHPECQKGRTATDDLKEVFIIYLFFITFSLPYCIARLIPNTPIEVLIVFVFIKALFSTSVPAVHLICYRFRSPSNDIELSPIKNKEYNPKLVNDVLERSVEQDEIDEKGA